MIFHYLKMGISPKDTEFDQMYPEYIQKLSRKYWTPVAVAVKAAKFLVSGKETRVLDIGSGVGKFCFIGSAVTEGKYTGVEQNEKLVELSRAMIKNYAIPDVKFINANIKEINFTDYDSFYFFNPFYENLLSKSSTIDKSSLYYEYSDYVKNQFNQLPVGTKVVTYHGSNEEMPLSYEVVSVDFNGFLRLWVKTKTQEQRCVLEQQIIKEGIEKLRCLGFNRVNEQNIFYDEVYKILFEKVLKSKLGSKNIIDQVILKLMDKLKNQ